MFFGGSQRVAPFCFEPEEVVVVNKANEQANMGLTFSRVWERMVRSSRKISEELAALCGNGHLAVDHRHPFPLSLLDGWSVSLVISSLSLCLSISIPSLSF